MSEREKNQISGLRVILVLAVLILLVIVPVSATLLNPLDIPKWENTITGPPPVYVETSKNYYVVNASQFKQTILPPSMGLQTTVYGYGGLTKDAVTGKPLGYVRNSPGPSFDVKRGVPIKVKYINDLTKPHMFAVDPTLMWANPNVMKTPVAPFEMFPPGYELAQSPIPMCVHLHGGEVQATSDGGPDAWWTYNGIHGNEYHTAEATAPNAAVFEYPNAPPAATLWYHDHALGITRLNVVGGLAGFYLLRDPTNNVDNKLPKGKYEIPLAIQDRTFNTDGTLNFPIEPTNPLIHPYWTPEFFGDTIMVNGLVWPKINVDRAAYRFRILDGSTARFYNLSLSNGMNFKVIGVEGGFLKSAASVKNILISPGERFDVIVDFTEVAPGTEIILQNSASTPFPDGDPVDPATTGQIVKFVVGNKQGRPDDKLPAALNPTLAGAFPNLPTTTINRTLVLTEIMDEGGPKELLLDGQKYGAAISELPKEGTTEEWIVANPTADTHPIHLHLVDFQVVKRQQYDFKAHRDAWVAANGKEPPFDSPTVSVPVTPYLIPGTDTYPPPIEQGWKDTVKMNPGEVTWIRVRFASQDGTPFPFDPKVGYYVWHCHIVDHEDNEMMRPFKVVANAPTTNVPTNVKIVPRTINIGRNGYFLAFVTLPEAYKSATIDKDTVSCSGAPAQRMLKLKLFPRVVGFVFKTSDLQGVEVGNKVTLNIKGELKNKGTTYTFTGADSVNVISKPASQPDDIKDISKDSDEQLFKKFNT